jgi:hypothetical protein
MRAYTEKLCSCWKYKWVLPIDKVANPCPQTWIAEKTFMNYFVFSTSRVSLNLIVWCWWNDRMKKKWHVTWVYIVFDHSTCLKLEHWLLWTYMSFHYYYRRKKIFSVLILNELLLCIFFIEVIHSIDEKKNVNLYLECDAFIEGWKLFFIIVLTHVVFLL